MRALLLLAALVVPASAQPKVDKDRLVFHLKETQFGNLPAGVQIDVGEPKPAAGGLWKVDITLSLGERRQVQPVLLTQDGRNYILGEVTDFSKDPDAENRAKLKVGSAPVKGGKDAKVTIIEFTDFQCPWCKKAHEAIEDNVWKTYGDKVRVVLKHFPLSMHPWAEPASRAAACVQRIKPEVFWSYIDNFFKKQDEINLAVHGADRKSNDLDKFRDLAFNFAKDLRVDAKKLASCYDKRETEKLVQSDMQEGEALGVNGTPTLFVNGHKTGYGQGFASLKPLIDEMLAGTHGPPAKAN